MSFSKTRKLIKRNRKNIALFAFPEHLIPNRWNDFREPNAKELKAITVLKLKINEAFTNIGMGNQIDEIENMDLGVSARVIKLQIGANKPINDEQLNENIVVPDCVKGSTRNID